MLGFEQRSLSGKAERKDLGFPAEPAFSSSYTVSPSLPFQAAEQDRMGAKVSKETSPAVCVAGCVPGLSQGRLGSQLLAAGPLT